MTEYTKIPAVFRRDAETKKLVPGKYITDEVAFLADKPWLCTEKIDGTNIGVVWDGHRVIYQGRTERANIPAPLLNVLIGMFGGDANEGLFEQKFGSMPVILFGEGYGKGIQSVGGDYRHDVSLILFDVFLPDQNLWLKRDAAEDIARYFGIDIVPVIMTAPLPEAIEFVKSRPQSTIGTAKMEGLVCRPAVDLLDRQGKRIVVKVKVKDVC